MLKPSQKKESRPLVSELDPQVKALLEQFQANAAQHPAPTTSLSPEEKVAASRQLVSTSAILGYPAEPVLRSEDFDIPSPAGKVPVRLYVPHTEEPLPIAARP
jgi:hypothetical protein